MLIEQLQEIENYVKQNLVQLSAEQLNWKPAAGKWCIAQCLDHLIISNQTYFPSFEKIVNNNYHPSLWQRINPFSKKMGHMLTNSISAIPEKRISAPKIFIPSNEYFGIEIIDKFLIHQQKIIPLIAALKKLKTRNIIISSPVSSLITIRLKDAITVIVQHEQRHINQANNVLHHSLFPKQ